MVIKKNHVSQNLCPTLWTYGQYRDGVWETIDTRMTSDYIPVSTNQYTFTINSGQSVSFININIFNSSKTWIGNRTTIGMSAFAATSQQETTPTLPSNAAYVKLTVRPYNESTSIQITSDMVVSSNVMLNTGSTPLPYEPYGNTWNPIPYRKYGTETDTITTLPKTIIGDGQPITSYTIKGNMAQSGTPTPSAPIYPSETGDKTANLFDKSTMTVNAYLQRLDGAYQPSSSNSYSCLVKVKPNTSYRIRAISKTFRVAFFTHKPQEGSIPTLFYVSDHDAYSAIAIIRTSGSEDRYVMFFCYNVALEYADGKTVDEIMSTVMISESTEMTVPFEPYGYKIPISCGGTTTNVYLGEVQSTRQIKKCEFTGSENWSFSTYPYLNSFITYSPNYLRQKINICVCSHLQTSNNVQSGETIVPNTCCFNVESPGGVLYYKDSSISDLASFKSWLAQQYANGTPVTVWYVLATPTTGTVNEPIRKIGTYSDSVSGTGLPTTGTAETFDIDTTLKPSEVSLTYHGWHENSDTVFTTE